MADSVTMTMDDSELQAAIRRLGDTVRPYVKAASRISALSVQAEARARLQRMTHGTGQTAANILVTEDFSGDGYIVYTSDVRLDRTPIPGSRKQRTAYLQEEHIPLYIERGTRRGMPGSHTAAARPFFFSSAELELSAHERRIREAVQDGIDAEGLGEA